MLYSVVLWPWRYGCTVNSGILYINLMLCQFLMQLDFLCHLTIEISFRHFVVLCWAEWEARNHFVFANQSRSVDCILMEVDALITAFDSFHSPDPLRRIQAPAKWFKHCVGWAKINSNAAVNHSAKGLGIGFAL